MARQFVAVALPLRDAEPNIVVLSAPLRPRRGVRLPKEDNHKGRLGEVAGADPFRPLFSLFVFAPLLAYFPLRVLFFY